MQTSPFSTYHFLAKMLVRCAVIVGLMALTVACGGGGGSSDGEVAPSRLVVNAGPDATVTEGATYTFNAQVSGGDGSYSFNWSVSPSLSITHADTSQSSASFVAPEVNSSTQYTFTLTVNDQSGNTASDETVITVAPVNLAPLANIDLPQWEGLPSNTFPGGVEIVLDGTASTDPDASSTPGIVSYNWSQTSGTNVITGVATDLATLTITTPITNDPQVLTFQLEVTDSEGATDTMDASLSVQSATDTLPVVDAGFSQGVFSGEIVILSGQASTSVPSARPLNFRWERSGNVVSPTQQDFDRQTNSVVDDDDALSTFAIAPAVASTSVVVYTLTVTDANGNQVEDAINVRVRPMPTPLINDTGFLQQATNTALTQAQQNDFPGQDGQRGADVIEKNGLIEKAGRGKAGFDFTRLNANGDEQDASATTWSCVRDNVTGLIWEVKTDDGTFQDKDYTYAWYSDEVNGGFEGDVLGSNASCLLTNCNTSAYVEAVNAQGLCGFYDWRMPTHHELFSLMHMGVADSVAIDEDYFPHTGPVSASPLWYWTSVPSADGVNNDDARNAWALDFLSGVDNFLNKSTAARVRLVRAGR
ncbi:hypothetical protein D210916BOD24_05620 [Alteromonas sp. D210916BOD_24]|uniref:Lcl C-terminal domain-containing protein n=1 Tax=Alteromonas sp. D210916BOD_24 TaxID=3157618 RepID=UPI00399C4DEE